MYDKRRLWLIRFRDLYITTIAGIAALLLYACAPSVKEPGTEFKTICHPHDLAVDSLGSSYIKIAWNPGCPKNRVMAGYNVYVSQLPLTLSYPGTELPDSIRPVNDLPYPGDDQGLLNRETYEIEKGITDGVRYYIHVRVVYADGSVSAPSNEIQAVSRPEGTLQLQLSFTGNRDGFNFETNSYVRADDSDNDIYFYHKDGSDFLCSPSRLGPINRETRLSRLGPAISIRDFGEVDAPDETQECVQLTPQTMYLVVTAKNTYAKLFVRGFEGTGDNRHLIADYVYQPIPGMRKF
jgi:hypothetical protein